MLFYMKLYITRATGQEPPRNVVMDFPKKRKKILMLVQLIVF